MKAIVLAIGDELVLGQTVDTNSPYLSAQLAQRGIGTLYHQVVADDQKAIARAIVQAADLAELIIISGGLGPTEDDLTRQALADAMGVELVTDEPSADHLRGFFASRGRTMAPGNLMQAMHPVGARMIPNSCGTAPGLHAHLGKAEIFVTPGVPREMVAMFELSILPELPRFAGARHVILTSKINTFGLGESDLAQRLGDLMDRRRNPLVGTTVADGVVSVRIRSEYADAAQARREMDSTSTAIAKLLTPYVYGCDDQSLAHTVVELLKEQGRTLAVAESCTGGLLAKMITDVPGASSVFLGGFVTYSNAMKIQHLGIALELLQRDGAVSHAVARAMAAGAVERTGADLGIGITGIAGPDGGTAEKPVGTVWIALADRSRPPVSAQDVPPASPAVYADALRLSLYGSDRSTIRDRSAKSAAQMLRFHLLGQSIDLVTWGKRAKT